MVWVDQRRFGGKWCCPCFRGSFLLGSACRVIASEWWGGAGC